MTAKTNLLLVPGLLCTRVLWAPQMAALGDIANCSVADHTRHDTIAGIARSILAAAPERFALAGLSMGGYIAYEIIRQAPERVERLALLDTRPRRYARADGGPPRVDRHRRTRGRGPGAGAADARADPRGAIGRQAAR